MPVALKGDSEKLLTLEFRLNLKSLRPNGEGFDVICCCYFEKHSNRTTLLPSPSCKAYYEVHANLGFGLYLCIVLI